MVVEAVFWFHPAVWWLESRLIDERERAYLNAAAALSYEPDGVVCVISMRPGPAPVAGADAT